MISLFLSCIITALTLFFLVGAVTVGIRRNPNLWKTLPRERIVGAVLSALALACAAWQSEVMLEGGLRKLLPYIWIAVPVLTVLSFLYLDFLLARALGGVLMLMAPQLLHGAFCAHLPMRPAFSALCYVTALIGTLMMAMPWRFRDLLDTSVTRDGWRRVAAGVAAVLALVFLAASVAALATGRTA